MNVLIIIASNDSETVWNAFRLANTCLIHDDTVNVFLLGRGVESAAISSIKFNVKEQVEIFEEEGGKRIGCGVCVDSREDTMPLLRDDLNCELGSMQTLYSLMNDADKVDSKVSKR